MLPPKKQMKTYQNINSTLIATWRNLLKMIKSCFAKRITKMHLYGMTYRDIKAETNLPLRVIHGAIKQFKNDLHFIHTGEPRDSESIHDL